MLQKSYYPVCLVIIFTYLIHKQEALQIPLGSKISVSGNETWVSPNRNFALGFFNSSSHPNRFTLGIRFNSVSIPFNEQTLVWIAGAGISVGPNSYFQLTELGELLLFDFTKKNVVWSSNTCNLSVSSASLLDGGNLVLFGTEREIVWQSFDFPSDTLLPGQKLTSLQTLRARKPNSYVSSCYSLTMDSVGQLKLTWETNVTYWESDSVSPLPIVGALFTKEGSFALIDSELKPVWSIYGDDHNDSSVNFRFLRLDSDGNLRMCSWSGARNSWREVWRAVSNQCNVFATCGLSGVCSLNQSGSATCTCPFESNRSLTASNCLAPYYSDCNSGTSMLSLNHTFLYGIYPPGDFVIQSSLEECKSLCMKDPNCTAVTVTNDGKAECRIKKTRFVSGYQLPSTISVSFVKLCLDPVAVFPFRVPSSPSPHSSTPLHRKRGGFHLYSVIGLALSTVFVVLTVQLGVLLYFVRKRKRVESTRASNCPCPFEYSIGLVAISHSELKDITNDFKNQLGPGLFKGTLQTNRTVLVKDLNFSLESGMVINEKDFKSWIAVLGGIHHKNLVKLEGYCCNSNQRFLIYEFYKNGSVDKWIKGAKLSRKLTWQRRVQICIGAAKAIAYLHSGCREFVGHGELNWKNVVLNEELEPKVTNYGLRRFSLKQTESGKGAESDVEKFGEMIIDIISGRENGISEFNWAYSQWAEGNGLKVVDLRLGGKFDASEFERLLRIAFWCVQEDERLRPSMGEVVKVLEGSLSVDPPPPPYNGFKDKGRENVEGDEIVESA